MTNAQDTVMPLDEAEAAFQEGLRELLSDLESLINDAEGNQWRIGEMINRIKAEFKIKTAAIKERIKVKWTRNRLDEMAATARWLDEAATASGSNVKDLRNDPDLTFYDFEQIRKAENRLPAHRRIPLDKAIELRKKFRAENPGRKLDHRKLKNLQLDDLYQDILRKTADEVQPFIAKMSGVVNAAHHARWEDVIVRVEDRSLSIIIADPPYAYFNSRPYTRAREGGYSEDSKRSGALRYEWDNGSPEESLPTTINLFTLCREKLKDDGVLFLCQEGAKPDNLDVRRAADDAGWVCVFSVTWVKSDHPTQKGNRLGPAPSYMDQPYGSTTETILIFVKRGEDGSPQPLQRLRNVDNGDVLYYGTPTRTAYAKFVGASEDLADHHIFEHPWELAADLIQRHVPRDSGAIIFEPFGCSGFASVAAIKLGLSYIYCESNENNFRFGCSRLSRALDSREQHNSEGVSHASDSDPHSSVSWKLPRGDSSASQTREQNCC